jgi:hypothetical protein
VQKNQNPGCFDYCFGGQMSLFCCYLHDLA